MGAALEAVNTYGTGNAALTTLTHVADTNQSLAIRSTQAMPSAKLLSLWGYMSAASDVTIHSPRLHDDVQAIHCKVQATLATPVLDEGFDQPVYSQDSMIVQSVFAAAPGSGVAENLGYVVYYPDLPGVAANLQSWPQVQPNVKHYLGVKFSATSSATAGNYGAGVAINASEDYFKANQPYALIGYTVSAICANVAVLGTDTGNLLCGGPGAVDPIVTRRWFWYLSQTHGVPCIPVINSANKASTLVYVSHPTASTTITGELFFAYIGNA